ncbi:MAG: hypothetical protein OWR52_07545 [Acidibacillus sp.]|uniref:Uncharacterized protein n=2 Tax=Sulfoacidibacillus ferrooxidans TaxID=2005001 RepID=A0A9X1V7E9_9BACL|nr:hypothetical protein [Sulfoacidibacillus ferrooxidans]MCY0893345.1 hypothetical protein [Acidibacillus sp.]
MIPHVIIELALLIIIIRCVYVAFTLAQNRSRKWLEIAFYLSVAIIAFSFLV